jgi:hypothetical protein
MDRMLLIVGLCILDEFEQHFFGSVRVDHA